MALCPKKIISALHKEALEVTNIVDELTYDDHDHYALSRIKDGGVRDPHDNDDSIIYGKARQPYKEYKEVDYTDKDLIEGEMNAVGCTGTQTEFTTSINDIRDNACAGECIIDFAQGFRRLGYHDYDFKPKTPVVCAAELAGKGRRYVEAFFKGFVDNFTEFGMDNFDANLLNKVIRFGGANASVQGPNQFEVTSGAFVAPPTGRLTVWFLEKMFTRMQREKAIPKGGKLELEMERQDWIDAVIYHQMIRNPNASYQFDFGKDVEGDMAGRESHTYGNIKVYFTNTPVKGYFKRVGTSSGGDPVWQFVRIYHWMNEAGEEGGVVNGPNHDYDRAYVWCEGIRYPMVKLAFMIHPESFTRYGLNKIVKPGGEVASNNYDVKLLDGPWLAGEACGNDYNEKFKLVARHQFRLRLARPEWSGAIAYLASDPEGYSLPICNTDIDPTDPQPANAQVFEDCGGPSVCENEQCVACGKVADANGNCVTADDGEDDPESVLAFSPCGDFTTAWTGEQTIAILRVKRTGSLRKAASVAYTLTPGTATTPTHYTDVSEVPGTLSWDAFDGTDKLIKIRINAGSGSDTVLQLTAALNATPTNADTDEDCDSLTISIEDHVAA